MTKEHRLCVCQLHQLSHLCHMAANAADSQDWDKVVDILQGQVTPLTQSVAHDAWVLSRNSGTGTA